MILLGRTLVLTTDSDIEVVRGEEPGLTLDGFSVLLPDSQTADRMLEEVARLRVILRSRETVIEGDAT
jgi:hypothetical protein